MATVMTILSKYRSGPSIQKQLLFYPVTNACFDTPSYREFACGYYLYREGMIHDFVMLHALDQTNATRAAMDSATDWLNRWNCLRNQ